MAFLLSIWEKYESQKVSEVQAQFTSKTGEYYQYSLWIMGMWMAEAKGEMEMTIKEREKLIEKMVKKNEISTEDIPLVRFLLAMIVKFGPNFEKCFKWAGLSDRKIALKWWDNLKKNGYFDLKKMKIIIDEDFKKHSAVSFYLMMLAAQGFVRRVKEQSK
jgi:hypothetical protein